MRKKVTTTLVLVAGLLGVAVPVLAALYLSHRQSMDAEVRLAMTMAEEVLRRADDVGDQAITAYRSLAEVDGFGPCSDADIERMRRLELQLSSIEVVGRVDGDRLICSSMGLPPGGIPLGPPLWTSSLDSRIRPAVDLGLGDGNQFLVLQKANFAVAVNPQVLLDSF
ncbi:MAG TPA: CSS-motif domain-containing protein, partial [Dokdonella sp.]|nr:CSS-motif domain-containing protein [Dokdonella sp.]